MADQKQPAEGEFSHTNPGAKKFVEGEGRSIDEVAKDASEPLSAPDQIKLEAEREARKPH
jgi:hypothetical protein